MYNLSTWEVLLPSVKEIELEFCVLKLPFFMNVYTAISRKVVEEKCVRDNPER